MSDLRKAAQQALEALEDMDSDDPDLNQEWLGKQAITALRAALAQPEKTNQCAETCERAKLCAVCASGVDDVNPEPVAWRYDEATYRPNDLRGRQWHFTLFSTRKPYADEMVRNVTPLYTAPPQRKPLTDEEIEACRQQGYDHSGLSASFDFVKAARAIEAAHGIKGEA